MLVGMASEIGKTTHTSVQIAQDTTESRVPRLNVHTNQILMHTFSHGEGGREELSCDTTSGSKLAWFISIQDLKLSIHNCHWNLLI